MTRGRTQSVSARGGCSHQGPSAPPAESNIAVAVEPTITLGLQQFQTLVNRIETLRVQRFQEMADRQQQPPAASYVNHQPVAGVSQ